MNIVLLILKIIGITLLGIIGLILLLLITVLFVPIRYNITVSNQKEGKKLYARAKATWLLHFINCLVSYYEELYYRVRITFFKIISSDKKEKKKHKEKTRKKKSGKGEPDTKTDNNEPAEHTEDKKNISDAGKDENIEIPDDTADYDRIDDDLEDTEEKQSLFAKVKEVLEKIIEFLFNIPEKVESAVNKVKDIKENIDYYINAVNDDRNKEAFSLCLSALFKILNSIKPRKIKGNILIGREDPYSYGQVSSILGIVYPFISDKINIETRCDEDITSYYIFIKGKVTLFVLLVAFIKIYFNRDVKRMIKIFKHEGR